MRVWRMMMGTRKKWKIQRRIEPVGYADELETIYFVTAMVDDICMPHS